ncbi:hypothetical protein BH10PSE1_BH10PSE1_08840 [soil metagenome]
MSDTHPQRHRKGYLDGDPDSHTRNVPACLAIGIRHEEEGDDRVAARLEWGGAMQCAGRASRGAILVLADHLLGTAIFSTLPEPRPMSTMSMRLDWLAPAMPGMSMVARAARVVRNEDQAFVRIEVTDESGGAVAEVVGQFHLNGMPGGGRVEDRKADRQRFAHVGPFMAGDFEAYLDLQSRNDGYVFQAVDRHVGTRSLPAVHGGVVAAALEAAALRVASRAGHGWGRNSHFDFLRPVISDRPTFIDVQSVRIGRAASVLTVSGWQDSPERPVTVARVLAGHHPVGEMVETRF